MYVGNSEKSGPSHIRDTTKGFDLFIDIHRSWGRMLDLHAVGRGSRPDRVVPNLKMMQVISLQSMCKNMGVKTRCYHLATPGNCSNNFACTVVWPKG